MLKKLIISSGTVLLVCILAAAILTPIAVADSMDSAKALDRQFGQLKEEMALSAQDINKVQLSGYVHELRVRQSQDDKIRVYTNGYQVLESSFVTSTEGEGLLNIILQYRENPMSYVSREGILRSTAAALNGVSTRYVELHLPKDVAFQQTYRYYWNFQADPEIRLLPDPERKRQEEMAQEHVSSSTALSQQPGEMTPQQLEDLRLKLRENDTRLLELYRGQSYGQQFDSDMFWVQADPILESSARLLAQAYQGAQDPVELADTLEDYLENQVKATLITLRREEAKRGFEAGTIPKEQFYEMDLTLDREAAELMEQEESMSYGQELQALKDRIVIQLVVDQNLTKEQLTVYNIK